MGKTAGKKKKQSGSKASNTNSKHSQSSEHSPKVFDEDTTIFMDMAQDMKEEGNKLFQRRDYEGVIPQNPFIFYRTVVSKLCIVDQSIVVETSKTKKGFWFEQKVLILLGELEMGKTAGKKKKQSGSKASNTNSKHSQSSEHSPKVFDEDTTIFMDMAQDMKEEGNKLFQRRDYEGAIFKYEKAIKLLPKSHIDVAYLHSNIAACYMQICPVDYHRAVNECNLALEVAPKYTKALLKRARCFEALNILEWACRDVNVVLSLEPNNLTALEISERVKKTMEKKGIKLDDKAIISPPEGVTLKEKSKKKKSHKTADKVIVEENCSDMKEEPMKVVKLVLGEDIRIAHIPASCSMLQLREIVQNRFPSLKAFLVKYKDKEGDLVTITASEELKWAEESADPQGSVRLYITEVNPEQVLLLKEAKNGSAVQKLDRNLNSISENGSTSYYEDKISSTCINDWIVRFAQLFKNHMGFDSDAYLDLHELGMKLYSEAMEETLTSEEAQEIFELAEEKFQEMGALALFNWGNVHMSHARKRLFLSEDASKESILAQVKAAYEWAQAEYVKAGKRYEAALKIKPDFYEGLLALGQQQFEQANLSWYYAIGSKVDLDTWPSADVLELFNNAEDNLERGTEMWEEMEEQRLRELSKPSKEKALLQKMGLDGYFKDISNDDAAEQASNMRSQINILWGAMLYERSIVEFKLGFPIWEECLMAAVDKFKLAGASPADIAVMIKNHCAKETTQEGFIPQNPFIFYRTVVSKLCIVDQSIVVETSKTKKGFWFEQKVLILLGELEMGKTAGKKKKQSGSKASNTNSKHSQSSEHSPKVFDEDTTIFMDMAQDMKEEGNKLFQRRDYEGAIFKYEKAIKLLPKSHIDVAYLHSNIAACYMQICPVDYHRAVNECNLALEVAPKYTKALLKRARCFEALNILEWACRDVNVVLSLEPNNLTALEISERVKKTMEKKGIKLDDKAIISPPEGVTLKEKSKKKKSHKTADKVIVEENCSDMKEEPMKVVKLVLGEDIRIAHIPASCSMLQLREIVQNRFPSLKAFLVKYKDKEGDLVTITASEELKWAEESADPQGSVRLYITEVNPEQVLLLKEAKNGSAVQKLDRNLNSISENGSTSYYEDKISSTCINDWIVRFAQLFKNHMGFDSDAYLDLHELGMKLYSEAMEETLTSEEAQEIFELAEEKFQEMGALALFNWGNVHMSHARKRLFLSEDASKESILAQVKAAYEWAQAEYVKAGKRYEAALKIKPDFYEGLLALGQQQFEQAKLSWYYAIGSKVDLDTWPSADVLELFNNAEDNLERGTEMWEEMEEQRLRELSKPSKEKALLQKMGLDGYFKDISNDDAAEQASNMRSQINILWGAMLYERSIVEFKLGFPIWEECLMAAVDKFKLAGASPADIAVMIKNHCAKETTQEGNKFLCQMVFQSFIFVVG
ncbi:putative protein PHOX1 [Cocos nucifera]|uniref:PB1 domain-containing protein n=1 Tax=Cocos nucifera TaxID=13894 RepID=A0A8K0N9M0_COCNU|nr:putative protein PHOX1 [Cocos nucifera]